MRFAFDERQLDFRAQLRAFAEKECTPADIRKVWGSGSGWSRERWRALAEMGVVGLTVPEDLGGLGLGMVDLVLVLEEAGRSGIPEPLLVNTALAAPLLAGLRSSGGSHESSGSIAPSDYVENLLSEIASGDAVVTVGSTPPPAGSPPLVPNALGADALLLERDGELHAVEAARATIVAKPSIDGTRGLGEVTWDASESTPLAREAIAARLLGESVDRAATGSAAMLVGIADHMISLAAEYAGERKQFGKPIGSFQAVKQLLAEALVRLEFARPVVYRAAWSLEVGDPSSSRHASEAKAAASEAATHAARTALQVHGAIGYTWEHDLHFWMKRAWSLAAAWGDARAHRARLLSFLVAERSGH
ncbi:MAG TPA: acyl-CoA dehydrogenase family protein [Acidimicrobiales bacterium]|nr:acyl-CoA dehydrogenase family protein [Acidimicrobiales bacterium]